MNEIELYGTILKTVLNSLDDELQVAYTFILGLLQIMKISYFQTQSLLLSLLCTACFYFIYLFIFKIALLDIYTHNTFPWNRYLLCEKPCPRE